MWTEKVTHIRSLDIGGYRHNNKGFYEKFIFTNYINRKRTTIARVSMQAYDNMLIRHDNT